MKHSRLAMMRLAPFGAVLGVALSAAGVAGAQMKSETAQPAASGGAASLVATLSPVGGFASLTALTSSSNIVVAGGYGPSGNVTDIFTKPSAGWQSSGPAASLVDSTVSGEPNGLSVSANTVVEGVDSAAAVPGVEDVYVKPAGGWSGSVAPAATLAAPKSGQAVSRAVISGSVIAGDVTSAAFPAQRLEAVVVYVKPAAGWSGQAAPSARLAVPRGARTGWGVVISARTIFVSTATRVYVFNEPARGWSGTLEPSARLQAIGSISAAGSAVAVGGKIFTKPRHGWAGTVTPVGRVVAPGAVGQASSKTTVATATVGRIPPGGCIGTCTATVAAVTKPSRGWSGPHHATTIVHTTTGTSLLPIALTGQNLYVTGGGPIEVYQLTGRFGS